MSQALARVVMAIGVVALLALSLAPPGDAQPQRHTAAAPGSVLVFPTVVGGTIAIDGVAFPRTEIAISITCPAGMTCLDGQRVKLVGQWVCPGAPETATAFVCPGVDFTLVAIVHETVVLSPTTLRPPGTTTVPRPPCMEGYLMIWVVGGHNHPIKFDGLLGTAILRPSGGAAGAYNAVSIQAIAGVAPGARLPTTPSGGLLFDGLTAYKAVPGTLVGSLHYATSAQQTSLTLITLAVRVNRPNYPTFVDLTFFNAAAEVTSTFTAFLCWTRVRLTAIDANLDEAAQGSRQGSVASTAAQKVPLFGINDTAGAVPLLALIETQEFSAPATGGKPGKLLRAYSYAPYTDGLPVPTTFEP